MHHDALNSLVTRTAREQYVNIFGSCTEVFNWERGVTRDSDTTFKVNRSKVNLHGAGDILWRPPAQLVSDSTDCKKS